MKMRNIIRAVAAVALLSGVFTSCSKDEEIPYVGADNYITSFAIKSADGLVYNPTISGGEIRLAIPANEDLQGAVAEFTLSENATISPNPADVEDWTEAETFTVTSYNNDERVYSYSVVKSDNVNYVLNSQADVDAFSAREISSLDGSLSVGMVVNEEDPIVSLDGLGSLKEIRYDLTFGPKFNADVVMDELENVGSVTFASTLNHSDAPLSVSFASLKRVGTDFAVTGTVPSIKAVAANSLKYVGGSLKILSPILEEVKLSKLEEVAKDLIISGSNQTASPAITALNLLSLKQIGGAFTVEYLTSLADFNTSSLKSVGGLIKFSKLDGVYVYELSNVDVKSGLNIGYLGNVDATINLPENFDADFTLSVPTVAGTKMPTINGLKRAQDVSIQMNNYSGVLELADLETAGKISFNNDRGVEIIRLSKLTEAEQIYFNYCTKLKTFEAPELTKLTGFETINASTGAVTSTKSFDFSMSNSQGMETISMPKLTEAVGDFSITFIKNAPIATFDFPMIETIDGLLKITGGSSAAYANKTITSLDNFSNLKSVNKVDIEYLVGVKDFSAFKDAVATLTKENWVVKGCGYNPTFEDMTGGMFNTTRVLTFEDADYKGGENYVMGKDWSTLIDGAEYGGLLLYGESGYGADEAYTWTDENNTLLHSEVLDPYGMGYAFWNGGHAVSNYVNTNVEEGDSNHQLSVFYKDEKTGKGGNNGSDNFCVHYGYGDDSGYTSGALPELKFADGAEHVIDHMYVCNTTYFVNVVTNGNGLSNALVKGETVEIIATGYNKAGNETGKAQFVLADFENGAKKGWNKFSLASLGKVSYVSFNVGGETENGYGFSIPAYFAYDDVTVEL